MEKQADPDPANTPEKLTYSIVEASAAMGVSATTVRRAIHARQMPFCRIRGRFVVPIAPLISWLNSNGGVRGAERKEANSDIRQ